MIQEQISPQLKHSDSEQQAENLFQQISESSAQLFANLLIQPEEDYKPKKLKRHIVEEKIKHKSKKDKKKSHDRLKKNKRKKIKRQIEDGQEQKNLASQYGNDSDGSSEMSSEIQSQQLNQLAKLGVNDKEHHNKRLKSSSKKRMIELKEGFNLQELGNDAKQFMNGDNGSSEDSAFSQSSRKKKNRRKKISIIKNQQMLNKLLERGDLIDKQEHSDSEIDLKQHYNIIEQMNLKDKKKNSVKIFNKLFQDIEIDTDKQNQQQQKNQDQGTLVFQKLDLTFKSKPTQTKNRTDFMNKAQKLKKMRGIESKVKNEELEHLIREKSKIHVLKIINHQTLADCSNQEEIQISFDVPKVTTGKSSQLLNNTLFMKKTMLNSNSMNLASTVFSFASSMTQKNENADNKKQKSLKRQDLFKSMSRQILKRRSKHISQQQIKNNFKKTDLEEIEIDRKMLEDRKKRAAMMGSDDQEDQDQSQFNEEQQLEKVIKEVIPDEQIQNKGQIIVNSQAAELKQSQNNQAQIAQTAQNLQNNENIVTEKIDQKTQINKTQIQIAKPQRIDDKKYKQLLALEEGIQEQCDQQEQQIISHVYDQSEKNLNEVDDQDEQQQLQNGNQEQASVIENQQKGQEMQIQIQQPNQENDNYYKQLEQQGINLHKRRIKHDIQQEDIQHVPKQAKENPPIQQKPQQQIDIEKARNQFKKLRKIATVIAEKKQKRQENKKKALQFYQQQAQLGSDNQDHDHQVKNIDYNAEQKEYEGIDLDADLEQLIDNAVHINEEDQEKAFQKYLEDIRMKDREQLRKIQRGQFRQRKGQIQVELEDDEKRRLKRMDQVMQMLRKRQEQQAQFYAQIDKKQDDKGQEQQKQDDQKSSDSQPPVNDEQLAIYLQVGVLRRKPIQRNQNVQFHQIVLPESKPKQFKIKQKNSLLNSLNSSHHSFCGFNQEVKIQNGKPKKTSSSSLNDILNKNKQKTTTMGSSLLMIGKIKTKKNK